MLILKFLKGVYYAEIILFMEKVDIVIESIREKVY